MPENEHKAHVSVGEIKIEAVPDPDPDLDHLGEFRYEPGPDDRTIDRRLREGSRGVQPPFFVARHSGDETGNPDSVEEDYERLMAHVRGDVNQLVIQATSTIVVAGVRQRITSGGLGGVASDSGEAHLNEMAREELHSLRAILAALGAVDHDVELSAEWGDGPWAPVSGTVELD